MKELSSGKFLFTEWGTRLPPYTLNRGRHMGITWETDHKVR